MQYRKHIRLKEFDYSQENFYFVTVCTDYRRMLFVPRVSNKYTGEDVVRISNPLETNSPENQNTDLVEKILNDLPLYYDNLIIDFYVIMSDHLHIIFGFEGKVTLRAKHSQPLTKRHYSLGDIVKIFKKITTKQLQEKGIQGPIFQPNFYEHIVRNEKSLEKIREYILNNPLVEYHKIPWRSIDPNM